MKELSEAGNSLVMISTILGIAYISAQHALRFATTGVRHKWPSKNKKPKDASKRRPEQYKEISPTVCRLRDDHGLSLNRIARENGWSQNLVRRAYDFGHPEVIAAAIEKGTVPDRGDWSHLGREVKERIRYMLRDGGHTIGEIANAAGCGRQTVNRERRHLLAAGESIPKHRPTM